MSIVTVYISMLLSLSRNCCMLFMYNVLCTKYQHHFLMLMWIKKIVLQRLVKGTVRWTLLRKLGKTEIYEEKN